MATSSTSNVYIQVIEDVVSKIRQEFIANGGPGEGVLSTLQGLWEMKMMQAGAILGPIDRSAVVNMAPPGAPGNTVRDLNVPYEGHEEYETPTADLLFPPTPLQTPLPGQTPVPGTASTPLPGTVETSYNTPTVGTPITPNDYPGAVENGTSGNPSGRPSPHMLPPSTWLTARPRVDVNLAYQEEHEEADREVVRQPMTQNLLQLTSGKRKREDFPSEFGPDGYIPQQDGAGDVIADTFEAVQGSNSQLGKLERGPKLSLMIPQLDGPVPYPYDDALTTPNIYNYPGPVNEDYNVVNTPAPPEFQTPTPALVNHNAVLDDDEDEPLNENDDDDEDELDNVDEGEELNTHHLILAQFDKVTRAKSRWRCTLKDGVMHINNRDILFNKATGEFDF
nr:transcription initiation factor IIA large subunit-like [Tanacetum cinerariifolium]GEX69609.1 transcription initiation factor IIA large subunit-like [Tanacetum cinerariifolium]